MLKNRLKQFEEKCAWLRENVLYHRGKHNDSVRENTIEAFKGAVSDNLGVELDVRLTLDNKVVVSHDDSLKRIYGKDLKISELTYKEICEVTNSDIPLFEDVLSLIDGKIGVMVEIKPIKVKELVNKVYEILKDYKGKYVVVSFSPFALKCLKKYDKNIIRGQLSYNYEDSKFNSFMKFCLSHLLFNFISKPHFISYGIDNCDYKILDRAKKKGYFIIGWTYKKDDNKDELLKYYDNMIIENIELRKFK